MGHGSLTHRGSSGVIPGTRLRRGNSRITLMDNDRNLLFGVLWRRDDHTMADLPNHPVMKRWWAQWPS